MSCGQLVRRGADICDECGQDMSDSMLEKMRQHAGPWFVFDHVRPFPGVSLERMIRQIRRGTLTATSIIRGPVTHYQWTFAAETPGICLFFGRCWRCGEIVRPTDIHCAVCHTYLGFEQPQSNGPTATRPALAGSVDDSVVSKPAKHDATPELDCNDSRLAEPAMTADDTAARQALAELSAVVDRPDIPVHDDVWDEPPRVGRFRASLIAVIMIVIAAVALMIFAEQRNRQVDPSGRRAVPPTAVDLRPGGPQGGV